MKPERRGLRKSQRMARGDTPRLCHRIIHLKYTIMKKVIFSFAAVVLLASFIIPTTNKTAGSNETIRVKVNSGRTLTAELTGAQEPGGGDPNGTGYAEITLNQGQGTISYTLMVENIDPATAAHIHLGAAGVAGPVVVGLSAPSSGMSSGMIEVSAELIKAIRQNPENYYVNVHNPMYPAGAVRGQLSK